MTSAGKSRKQTENKTIYLSLIAFLLNAIIGCTNGLSCYTCLSKNKSDSLCEDPFSDNFRPFATDRKIYQRANCSVPIINSAKEESYNNNSSNLELTDLHYQRDTLTKSNISTSILNDHPATHCIKIIGTIGTIDADSNEDGIVNRGKRKKIIGHSIVIRSCVTQSNLNWMCGKFRFAGDEVSGCMLTCDKDYCNGSSPLSTESGLDALLLTICLCMAATQIVLTLMYGYEPFALF